MNKNRSSLDPFPTTLRKPVPPALTLTKKITSNEQNLLTTDDFLLDFRVNPGLITLYLNTSHLLARMLELLTMNRNGLLRIG
ncbi:hypothetical protein YK48G_22470 [Lentilactobacillus fungorum]|uniref:Uncharacterized protein n=1 Tax=Lentilactobacillus fungorum TaxID=2201250 RepID=A0ABQ3W353_9LACO|nr:hypothetical protein YK48G_22470 [Lentilactobacillus fungorum]